MKRTDWHFFRVRPENFPPRRIAAASHLLAKYGARRLPEKISNLVSRLHPGQGHQELEQRLLTGTRGYWARHYDFGIEVEWSPNLIGRGRSREIAVNVLLPFSFAWAKATSQSYLQNQAIELYRSYPRAGENRITKYMAEQIFGQSRPRLVNSACRQQGLIHLYKTYCLNWQCHTCPLGAYAPE